MEKIAWWYLHCYGYEKHIAGLEDQVASIADPDVHGVTHDEQRACADSREDGQSQLSHKIPVDFDITHSKGGYSPWKGSKENIRHDFTLKQNSMLSSKLTARVIL